MVSTIYSTSISKVGTPISAAWSVYVTGISPNEVYSDHLGRLLALHYAALHSTRQANDEDESDTRSTLSIFAEYYPSLDIDIVILLSFHYNALNRIFVWSDTNSPKIIIGSLNEILQKCFWTKYFFWYSKYVGKELRNHGVKSVYTLLVARVLASDAFEVALAPEYDKLKVSSDPLEDTKLSISEESIRKKYSGGFSQLTRFFHDLLVILYYYKDLSMNQRICGI
jgi:hypothetical protein